MIVDIQQKYDQLTQAQKDIFAGYGLRQVKHFVEVSLPKIEHILPIGAYVQGINAEGKLQAFNPSTHQTFLWISDLQWQEKTVTANTLDLKEDFIAIWELFNLKEYQLIDLSHVHRDFLEKLNTEKN